MAADPQFRSLRMWESSSPCPPPESATEHSDPRIAEAEAGPAMMYETFPLMRKHAPQEATTATECQDLLGMSFRTVHFDGVRSRSFLLGVGHRLRHPRARIIPPAGAPFVAVALPAALWRLKRRVHMFASEAPCSRRTRTPNSSGAIVTRPRCSAPSAA